MTFGSGKNKEGEKRDLMGPERKSNTKIAKKALRGAECMPERVNRG